MILETVLLLCVGSLVSADTTVYAPGTGSLASGWENWSWSSTLDFASTAGPGGVEAISVNTTAWAALSTFAETAFANNYAGLRFDISGAQPDMQVYFAVSTSGDMSTTLPLASMSTSITTSAFTTITIDFSNLPGNKGVLPTDDWNLINFQGGANGASFFITNIVLLDELIVTPKFLSAEPLAGNILAVTSQGAVDFSDLSVKLNGSSVTLKQSGTTYSPPDTPALKITYFTLSKALTSGSLVISAGTDTTFNFTIPALQYGTITIGNTKAISPSIYGVNFPTDANYIKTLGVTVSRWGGNAVTAYNPDGDFTNAGNDWYFENRVSDPKVDPFLSFVSQAGSKSLFTIPALDWVAKDASSSSFPATVYPSQQSFDPYNANAGNGVYPNGTNAPSLPQSQAYTPWNTSMAAAWLKAMPVKPDMVTVDNEIEIASSTHRDMHPDPMGYDEELMRMIATATMAKNTLPNVLVAAPSSCNWWFYWTSSIGYTDNAAHDNTDWLPWFLKQMSAASTKAGKRLIDFLDIHYYFAIDISAGDAAAKALALRSTRAFWDPDYLDESWIGTTTPTQWTQPNPNAVWLIPRMQQLINQYYPGTKLSISEWAAPALASDIVSGLVTADLLGIFGVNGLDQATYWVTPDVMGPVGLAYWLFRGNGTYFGSKTVQVNMSWDYADTLGVYASTTDGKKVTMVIINKDVKPINLGISNIPAGTYFLRHYGGGAGVAKWQTTMQIAANSNFVVPSYTAVFFQQQ